MVNVEQERQVMEDVIRTLDRHENDNLPQVKLSTTEVLYSRNQPIEVLHGGHVACQEQFSIIPMGQNVHSNAKLFHCSWHATWPPCKASIV